MNCTKIVNYWIKKLQLDEWSIEIESIDHDQVICDCPPEDCYFIGIHYNDTIKKGIIFHDRKLTEEDIVHELLHVKYPDWSEDQVNIETERLINQNKDE